MIHWGGLTLTEGESDFYSSPVNFCEIQQSTRREGFGTGYTSKRTTVKLYKTIIYIAPDCISSVFVFDDCTGPLDSSFGNYRLF